MNEQQPIAPRHRLRELLSIPERQRTDAQWDEINELEIDLASVNRLETREPSVRRNAPAPNNDQRRPSAGAEGKKPAKKFHKRPSRPGTP